MTLTDFEKIQNIAEKDIAMPDTFEKIMEKNNLLPTIVQKWSKLYNKQKFIVSDLTIKQLELYTQIFNAFKFPDKKNNPYNLDLNHYWGDKPKEIELQINAVPAYIDLSKELNTQKYILEYLEKTLDNIRNLSFTIKNYLEFKKILMANY